jgi:putative DNA primase/helicase
MKDEAGRRKDDRGNVREHTDEALALEFAQRQAMFARYVADWNRWMLYDGVAWVRDETLRINWEARNLCREDAAAAPKALQAKLLSARKVGAVVSLARLDPILAAVIDQWDGDQYALNCDGEVHQLDDARYSRMAIPGDYFTKSTGVRPGGDCPMWIEFLETVTAGDAALMDYLQRVCGYCLTGSTAEQCLFFLYGPGGNGKSTFVNTISAVMGDYVRTAPIDAFAASNGHDRHPTELADLQGARLVTATEPAHGRRWDESRIKTLTGGDTIAARFMRQDFFTYRPVFKLMICGNHKPQLRGVDDAWRRRMQIIPFTVRIPPGQRILDYDRKLAAEHPGILMWMIEGARYWAQSGLKPPTAVTDATDDYLESEDLLGAWLDECCEILPPDIDCEPFTSRQQLFASWQAWCKRTGEHVGTRKQFLAALDNRDGLRRHMRTGIRGYTGIRLRIDFELT